MFFANRILTPDFIAQNNLDTVQPPSDSFFFRAFNASAKTAAATLQTAFMQGIKNGNLSPDKYGALTVLDSHYCYNGATSFKIACNRADPVKDATLIPILRRMHASYAAYNKTFLDVWHLPESGQIVPTPTCKSYVEHERKVAEELHPIYTLVSMLPCYYLWYWMSDQIYGYRANNIYGYWIEGNHSPDTAYSIGNFIEDWKKRGLQFSESQAMRIYTTSMEFELLMFDDACRDNRLSDFFGLTRGM